MKKKLATPTAILCLAGAIAAGIALARPGTPAAAPPAAAVATTVAAEPTAGQATAAARPVRTEPIEIADFAYNNITVPGGAVVEVRNLDGVAHTVSADGLFDTGVIDGTSAATFRAPDAPGSYPYICALHPSMQGTLTVS